MKGKIIKLVLFPSVPYMLLHMEVFATLVAHLCVYPFMIRCIYKSRVRTQIPDIWRTESSLPTLAHVSRSKNFSMAACHGAVEWKNKYYYTAFGLNEPKLITIY